MGKLPAFQFYPGDWLKDPALRRCSVAARGVWIDMLCLMFECDNRGVLSTGSGPWGDEEIATAITGDTVLVLSCVRELLEKGVARRNSDGAIFSRRLIRDEELRNGNAKRQAKLRERGGGNPEAWLVRRVPVLQRDRYMCAYCGRKADTVDHIIPKSKGGTENQTNLVACCKRCNMTKGSRTPEQAGMSFWPGFDQSVLTHEVTPTITPVSEEEAEDAVEGGAPVVELDFREAELRKPSDEDLVYAEYPRKIGRRKALEEIGRALKRLRDGEMDGKPMGRDDATVFLVQRVATFARSPKGKAGEFTPHPATWFHQGRYLDDEAQWYSEKGAGNGAGQVSRAQQRQDDIIAANRGAKAALGLVGRPVVNAGGGEG